MKKRRSSSVFPQEVYEIVIDHLHDDKAAALACALVCRAWVSAGRFHLFRKIHFVLDHKCKLASFLELFSDPERSIATYVSRVNIRYMSRATPETLDLLYEALLLLRDTTARGYRSINIWRLPLDFEQLRRVLPLGRMSNVKITSYTRDLNNLIGLCRSMPNLEHLSLHHGWYDVDEALEDPTCLPQLRSLTMYPENAKSFLRRLATPPMLREVDFHVTDSEEMFYVITFLRPVMPYLNSVCADVPSTSTFAPNKQSG
jgi:hypothetical protein